MKRTTSTREHDSRQVAIVIEHPAGRTRRRLRVLVEIRFCRASMSHIVLR